MLALLVGCGLRRGELLALTMRSIQLREEHWVIADLHGKAGHIRTVPIPFWVKEAINGWTMASGITDGRIFRSINKAGRIWGDGMTPKVIWEVVKKAVQAAGIEKLAPPTTSGAHAPASVIWPVANSNKSSSCWGTSRSKRPNAIWGPNKSCASRSTTSSASNHSSITGLGVGITSPSRPPAIYGNKIDEARSFEY